ncbi:hypothetical protein G6F31_019286 [Rhizopus arrhizus]|nr:hypothetical protein G6F31_019286 [Rhizopus arrhizus]
MLVHAQIAIAHPFEDAARRLAGVAYLQPVARADRHHVQVLAFGGGHRRPGVHVWRVVEVQLADRHGASSRLRGSGRSVRPARRPGRTRPGWTTTWLAPCRRGAARIPRRRCWRRRSGSPR